MSIDPAARNPHPIVVIRPPASPLEQAARAKDIAEGFDRLQRRNRDESLKWALKKLLILPIIDPSLDFELGAERVRSLSRQFA
jgi:hypothetical protein